MMIKRVLKLGVCSALLLVSCENAKEDLGFTRPPPDEFAVYQRVPLEMPPDYALRPPQPGAPRPQDQEIPAKAQETLTGAPVNSAAKTTKGESILLEKAGAGTLTAPDIRTQVDQEKDEAAESQRPVVDRLLNSNDTPGEAPATVVDPAAEAARIKKNKEAGKPVTEGKTPTRVK